MAPIEQARHRMVDEQRARRDIQDARVLDAMRRAPRHAFVPAGREHEVVTVERHPILAAEAAARLPSLRYGNIRVVTGDGTRGYREGAPHEAIAVTASGPRVPKTL